MEEASAWVPSPVCPGLAWLWGGKSHGSGNFPVAANRGWWRPRRHTVLVLTPLGIKESQVFLNSERFLSAPRWIDFCGLSRCAKIFSLNVMIYFGWKPDLGQGFLFWLMFHQGVYTRGPCILLPLGVADAKSGIFLLY